MSDPSLPYPTDVLSFERRLIDADLPQLGTRLVSSDALLDIRPCAVDGQVRYQVFSTLDDVEARLIEDFRGAFAVHYPTEVAACDHAIEWSAHQVPLKGELSTESVASLASVLMKEAASAAARSGKVAALRPQDRIRVLRELVRLRSLSQRRG